MDKEFRIETKCVQSGWKPKKGEPRILPIYQSTTFKYDTTEEMGRLFDLKDNGYFYTRCQNPTNDPWTYLRIIKRKSGKCRLQIVGCQHIESKCISQDHGNTKHDRQWSAMQRRLNIISRTRHMYFAC